MLNFKDFLNESKQIGTLYHFTNFKDIFLMLDSNKINVSDESKWRFERKNIKNEYEYDNGYIVAFTRNKYYYKNKFHIGDEDLVIRISLDGNKLSNKYKIEPFLHVNTSTNFYEDKEQEERIYFKNSTDSLNNLKNYIQKIEIIKGANRFNYYLMEFCGYYMKELGSLGLFKKYLEKFREFTINKNKYLPQNLKINDDVFWDNFLENYKNELLKLFPNVEIVNK